MVDHAAMSISTREFGGFRTRVCEIDGAGPRLVFLHGFTDQAETWFPVMQLLAAQGQRSVAVDLPGAGHGDTLAPGAALPQFDPFSSALVDAWTEDGVAPILVGNSLGAAIALRAAQRTQLAGGGLVLISPAGIGYAPWVAVFQGLRPLHPILLTPVVPMPVYRWLAARLFAYLASGDGPLVPGAAATHASQFRRMRDVRRILGPGSQMVTELPEGGRPAMPSVNTAILWGRKDRMTPVRGAEILAALAPHADVRVLDGLGHCPQIERPDLLCELILEFVADAAASTSAPLRLVQPYPPAASAAP
jgi:pimeloyl-ACP methyl ester carboxylesterase